MLQELSSPEPVLYDPVEAELVEAALALELADDALEAEPVATAVALEDPEPVAVAAAAPVAVAEEEPEEPVESVPPE